jgi:hypothetical protein
LWKIAGTQLDRQANSPRFSASATASMPFPGLAKPRTVNVLIGISYATRTGTHSNRTATKQERWAGFTSSDYPPHG